MRPSERPKELPYIEGMPLTAGYTFQTRARSELIRDGLGFAGALYLASGLVAIGADGSRGNPSEPPPPFEYRWLYMPVFGPFIAAASHAQGRQESATALLIADGLVQVGGVAAALYGVIMPEKFQLRDDLVIAPMAGNAGGGMMLSGRF